MNKSELVDEVAERTGLSKKDVESSIMGMFDVVGETVGKGEKVTIQGWLAFEQGHRAARTGRNPQTGEPIPIAASNVAKVKALKNLKDAAKG